MNLIAVAPLWLIAVLILALIAAAVEDAMRLRISDATSLVVILAGAVAAVGTGPSLLLWQNFALLAVVLTLGTVAFSAGALGGGDVKLLAATSLWVDLRTGLLLMSAILLAGGLVAAAYVVASVLRGGAIKSARKRRIPYGLAVAVGAVLLVGLVREGHTTKPQSFSFPGKGIQSRG